MPIFDERDDDADLKGRLIIVSNRLSVTVKKENGEYALKPSSGGLATGLAGLAKTTEFLWLCLHILCGCLDIGSDPSDVLGAVHLGSGVPDNLDVFGEELVTVLLQQLVAFELRGIRILWNNSRGQKEPGTGCG